MATQAPPISLTVEIERKPDTIVVHCRGKLVSGVCSFFYNKVHGLLAEKKCIVLDLTDLEWIDSMGLGTMVRVYVASKSAAPLADDQPRETRARAAGPHQPSRGVCGHGREGRYSLLRHSAWPAGGLP